MSKLKTFVKKKKLRLFISIVIVLIMSLALVLVKSGEKEIDQQTARPEPSPTFISENLELKIKKLELNVPVVLDVNGADKDVYFEALEDGVAHLKGTTIPGSKGNAVIFGHSSSPDSYQGKFGKIFAELNDLQTGDEIIISNNANQSLNYKVEEKKIVQPDDVSVIKSSTDEKLTLLTCWPIGTKEKRLVVISKKN